MQSRDTSPRARARPSLARIEAENYVMNCGCGGERNVIKHKGMLADLI